MFGPVLSSCINCAVDRVVRLGWGGIGGWQGGTVQGVAKMNILREENILCAQKI
jgi:hypothetical protein